MQVYICIYIYILRARERERERERESERERRNMHRKRDGLTGTTTDLFKGEMDNFEHFSEIQCILTIKKL